MHKTAAQRERVKSPVGGKSRTEQHHVNDTNINNIVTKIRKNGYVPFVKGQAIFGDFTSAKDYFETRNSLLEAEKAFMRLPAALRQRFQNTPGNLIDFLSRDENRAEAEKLGLVTKREEPKEEPKKDAESPQTP